MNLRRDIFQAIADPTRRAILTLIASQAMSAGTIAAQFEAARPTISKHIQILRECELIETNQVGREIYYQLKIEKMKEIDDWVEQFPKIWEQRFDQLDELLSTLKGSTDEK